MDTNSIRESKRSALKRKDSLQEQHTISSNQAAGKREESTSRDGSEGDGYQISGSVLESKLRFVRRKRWLSFFR